MIPASLGLVLATVPLAALVGPLVWMAHAAGPDGGLPSSSAPISAAGRASELELPVAV